MSMTLQNRKGIIFFVCVVVVLFFSFYGYDRNFQLDSELLTSGPMMAKWEGVAKNSGYGLGRYHDINKTWLDYTKPSTQKREGYKDGYGINSSSIVVVRNYYTSEMLPKAKAVLFENGQKLPVSKYAFENNQAIIMFNKNLPLSKAIYGDVTKIRLVDENGSLIPEGIISDYRSQFGLQGYIFNGLENHILSFKHWKNIYKGICILLLSVVLALLTFFVSKKYGLLLAVGFFLTFITSPWIRNFSPNLYWVEFTWFIPMLVGIFASLHMDSAKVKILAYILAFISILIKSLCGYEYISTIMASLIAFPLADCFLYQLKHNYKARNQALKLIIGLGLSALTGFVFALIIHGYIRGNGDVWQGLINIYNQDILRRTWGTNPKLIGSENIASIKAGALDVLNVYIFKWHTEVLLGLGARLFPFIAASPAVIWFISYKRHLIAKWDLRIIFLYVIFLVATISWYVLAKQHSYIHRHMNYVLWYFGFIQVCLYSWLKAAELYLESKGILQLNSTEKAENK